MGLGMPEVILILVIALIVFGPRKLPELGKSLGQAMTQFRRASDDFKRTWEQEVETEKYRKGETAGSSSGSGYSSSSGYGDSYNPYSGEADSYAASSTSEKQSEAADSSKSETAKTEVAAAGAGVGTTAEPKQKHWI